ncbi:MAG TPA: glycerophosphodiester phosphodiesterase [Limnochordia bacterium]|nr:glycerophosphodiester phosphodiesterase [Limnochordia bacterium]
MSVIVIAHRGYSGKAPENTMAAFELALAAGADGIELDVHLTKDGEIVVIHDETVDRTTDGTGRISSYTLEDLKKLDAGSWYGPEFAGETVPTLRQVLDLLKGKDVLLNIEIKTGLGFEPMNEKLVALLDKYDRWERTIISSFNHYALAHIIGLKPQSRTAILYMSALVNPWVYAKSIGATILHPYYHGVIPEIITAAQQNGMMVNVWTVDEEADVERMKQCRVDGIVTNQPEKVKSLIQTGH